MLNWLAGQRPGEQASGMTGELDGGQSAINQPTDRERDEPPETPAPIFAVRAFKHAIFGTPATVSPRQAKQRRNSAAGRDVQGPTLSRPVRPGLARPKSVNDASDLLNLDSLPPSPTKGILLTPGTTGGRGKTVSFGDLRKDSLVSQELSIGERSTEQRQPRATAGEERAGSYSRRGAAGFFDQDIMQLDSTHEVCNLDPHLALECPAARYWKTEYDVYRDSISSEVRKLLTKQRAAKSFAREKDNQCSALTEELRNERGKVEKLEHKVADLQRQIETLQSLNSDAVEDLSAQQRAVASATKDSSTMRTALQGSAGSRLYMPPSRAMKAHESYSMFLDETVDSLTTPYQQSESAQISKKSLPSSAVRTDSTALPDSLTPYEAPYSSRDSVKRHRQPLTAVSRTFQVESVRGLADEGMLAEPSLSLAIESKENDQPRHEKTSTPAACAPPASNNDKRIVSRAGDVIPPDRIAAARARLAARRQVGVEV